MRVTNSRTHNDPPMEGQAPDLFHDTAAPNGDWGEYGEAEVGSHIWRKAANGHVQEWVKVAKNNRDDDWACVGGVIGQRVLYTDFTDGGAAVGTLELDNDIPVGAYVDFTNVINVTGFAGDTSATLIVGDGSDTDRYNTTARNIFADDVAVNMGKVSGTPHHEVAATPTLTVTSASDFTSVSAGALTIYIHYRI